jgi:hypothetical protein
MPTPGWLAWFLLGGICMILTLWLTGHLAN